MRVLIVSENASARMSGETFLPLYYFRKLSARGLETFLITHARCRPELEETLDARALSRVRFVEERPSQRAMWRLAEAAPERVRGLIVDQGIHLVTQRHARDLARRVVAEENIQLVFEPTPISPKGVSCMYGLDVPVVVGPLCGGLDLPPAFRYMDSATTRASVWLGRSISPLVHRMMPGKLDASTILVGNSRTARALPSGCRGKVYVLPESGVDLANWPHYEEPRLAPGEPVRFAFLARFVDWKGVEFLVEAFAQVVKRVPAVLELIGDGELLEPTKRQAETLGLQGSVRFHGRLPLKEAHTIVRESHVFMAPSLRECGGCAILEAMAMAKAIVAANWAGPSEFLGQDCALLIEPSSRKAFVDGLADAMIKLAESEELRHRLGQAAAARVRSQAFDWDTKVERLIEIFTETLQRSALQPVPLSGMERPSLTLVPAAEG